MSQPTCEACGEANQQKSEFCAACGGYLGWQDEEPNDTSGSATLAAPRPAVAPVVPGAGVPTPIPPTPPPAPGRPPARQPSPPPQPSPSRQPSPPRPVPHAPAERAEVSGAGTHRGGVTCPGPTCGVLNSPDRRFCAKCGTALGIADHPATVPARLSVPVTGWRRLLPSRAQDTLAARRAYRRSLPARYRVIRVAVGLVGLGLAAALLAIAGHNPASWATERWYAVRGTLTPVADVTATVAAKEAVIPDYPPTDAVDGPLNTAWATTWGGGGAENPVCGARISRGGQATLELALPEKATIRGIDVAPGLPATDPQRVLQWRPLLLRLTFDDGSCQQVRLPDISGLQRHRVHPVATTTVRIDVAAAAQPRSGSGGQVSVAELRLLRRPD